MAVLRKPFGATFGLACVLTLASTARADATKAEALFRAGRDALARGDLDNACARFQESFRLEPAVGALLNFGECEAKQNRVASAWQAFHDSLALLPAGDFRVAYARDRLASLAPRIATVLLMANESARPFRVVLDGVELGSASLGVPLPVNPGAHDIVVRIASGRETRTTLRVAEGERRGVTLAVPEEVASPKSPPPMPSDTSRRPAILATFAVGAVGLVTGAVAGILAIDSAATYRDHCDDTGCDPDGVRAAGRGRPLAITSTIGFGVGVLGIAAGSYLVATRPKPEPRAYVAPVLRGGGGSVVLGGVF